MGAWWKARASWAFVAMLAACGGRSLTAGGGGDGDSTGDAGDGSGATGGTSRSTGGTGAEDGGSAGLTTGARGGNPPTGGSATGGVTGGTSGGVAGAAGVGSGACNQGKAPRMTFDTHPQGWSVKISDATRDASGDSVAPVDARLVMIGWTGTDGVPALGAIEAMIPFTAPEQSVGLGVSLRDPLELSATVVSLCVKLVSGLGDSAELVSSPGTATIYLRSGPQLCYAGGPLEFIGGDEHPVGEWTLLTFDPSSAPAFEDPNCAVPFDPSDVREIGVRFEPSEVSAAVRPLYRIDTLSY